MYCVWNVFAVSTVCYMCMLECCPLQLCWRNWKAFVTEGLLGWLWRKIWRPEGSQRSGLAAFLASHDSLSNSLLDWFVDDTIRIIVNGSCDICSINNCRNDNSTSASLHSVLARHTNNKKMILYFVEFKLIFLCIKL